MLVRAILWTLSMQLLWKHCSNAAHKAPVHLYPTSKTLLQDIATQCCSELLLQEFSSLFHGIKYDFPVLLAKASGPRKWNGLQVEPAIERFYTPPASIEEICEDKPLGVKEFNIKVKMADRPFARGSTREAYRAVEVIHPKGTPSNSLLLLHLGAGLSIVAWEQVLNALPISLHFQPPQANGVTSAFLVSWNSISLCWVLNDVLCTVPGRPEPILRQVVIKRLGLIQDGPDTEVDYMNQMEMQCHAAFLAKEFRKARKFAGVVSRDIAFLDVRTVQMIDRPSPVFANIEPLMPSFCKFNSNAGYVHECAFEELQAFSHWTHAVTNGYLMVVDLQVEWIVSPNYRDCWKLVLPQPEHAACDDYEPHLYIF